ncbi:MAG: pilin [Candidatus Magasanikbacteria bacterium]|nr:pilin [Candidatus Magasanikbacteria bacterium]
MFKNKILFFSLIVFLFSFSFFQVSEGATMEGRLLLAQTPKPGLQTATTKLDTAGKAYGETAQKDLPTLIGQIIQVALSLLGVIFLVLIVYGGYKWMIARGEAKEVEVAKDTMTRAIIGLAIVLAAYAITYFVIARFTTAAGIVIK